MQNAECRMMNVENSPRRPLSPFFILHSAFCILLSSCVAWTPRSVQTSPAAVTIPNMPMQTWGIESCGAGALSTVLQHYGDQKTMAAWDASLPKTRGGVMTVDMLIAARQQGYDAQMITGDRQSVSQELEAGRPVILMLQVVDSPGKGYDFFHYIVADGIDPTKGLIRTQFGDGKARWVTFDRLEKSWAGGGHAAIFIKPQRDLPSMLRAAVALEEEGKVAEAAARYRSILSLYPESAVAWTTLGNAEMQLGHPVESEAAFRKAVNADGDSRDALNNLAWLLFTKKRYEEAEPLARRAVAIPGPDSYLMLDTLAHILAARGSCKEAADTFRAAIEAVPASRTQARTDLEKGLAETTKSCNPVAGSS
jgi:hypothetical protein